MAKKIRERLGEWFRKDTLPLITEESSLHEIASHYPHLYPFIERKYGVKVDTEDRTLSLKDFVNKFGLPPAQILFAEAQMDTRTKLVEEIPPTKAKEFISTNPQVQILDVREDWELKMGAIPKAQPLNPQLLDEILNDWDKTTPLLLYCHFGIRSLDAAAFLTDRGFKNVYTLKGGIDGWSLNVDPSVPRYHGAYC